MKKLGLYLHIPFCDGKCNYCDFYSQKASDNTMDIYVESVINHIEQQSRYFSNYSIDTIYFGGGTPSLLGEKRLIKILDSLNANFSLDNPEITLEVNPTKAKVLDFKALKVSGFNRLSIGTQSANDNELKILGRRHSLSDIKSTINNAKLGGFNNISLDLMLAIPEQTTESLQRSINFCAEQEVDHISAYLLKIEKGTPFYNKKSSLNLPNEDRASELYLQTINELRKIGFNQYEISNFSKPNMESKHNLKYWNCNEYLGIGPSAHSFINKKRFYYKSSLSSFINGDSPIIDEENAEIIEEYSMLQLRLTHGICENDFKDKLGIPIPEKFSQNAKLLKNTGLVNVTADSISLTPKGFLVSNELISRIIL